MMFFDGLTGLCASAVCPAWPWRSELGAGHLQLVEALLVAGSARCPSNCPESGQGAQKRAQLGVCCDGDESYNGFLEGDEKGFIYGLLMDVLQT